LAARCSVRRWSGVQRKRSHGTLSRAIAPPGHSANQRVTAGNNPQFDKPRAAP
jgi:hypothetical protein